MQFKNIPTELKQLPNWVARVDKIPINPKNLYNAKANEPQSWGTFEQAAGCVGKTSPQGKICNGIGFELKAPYCGIDIDHCLNSKTGEVSREALDIIDVMDSYTEVSPSGTGIHILYKNDGSTHPEWHRKKPIDSVQHLEMYQSDRYFTVTGNVFGGKNLLNERTKQAELIYKAYMQDDEKSSTPKSQTSTQLPPLTNLSDTDIVSKAMQSKNGSHFAALWRGDTSSYNKDESRADLALCNMLAFWCSGDTATIDRLFRQSGLMRDKWDEKRGANTYGEITLNEAVANCKEFYDPNFKRTKAVEDFKHMLPSGNTTIRGIPDTSVQPLPQDVKIELPEFTYETVKKYKADDIGAAEFFSDTVKDFMCYVPEPKIFRLYNGVKWCDDEPEALYTGNLLMAFVRAVQALIPPKPKGDPKEWTEEERETENTNKLYRSLFSNLSYVGKRNHILADVKKILPKKANEFDKQPYLFNVKNGTINLETGKLQPHSPTDCISKMANVEFNPQAKEERFERFITEITEGSTELAGALQRALGYSLQGKANEECFFVALGETTRNGKGTLFDTIECIFNDYGTNMAFDTIARSGAKDGGRPTPDVARLQGVRFVSCNEPDKGSCFNEALLRQLTGSDNITARPLYGSPVVFKPVFKLFLTANSMPTVADNSIFESNRLKIIPFRHHFSEEEQDKHLKEKLQTENAKSAVLNWLLDGYTAYRRIGLGVTAEMKELTDKYQYDNDYIQQYIDDRLILLPPEDCHAEKTTVKAIRADYENWCSVIGTKALGLKLFKEEIQKRGVKIITSHKQFAIRGKIKGGYDYTGEEALISV